MSQIVDFQALGITVELSEGIYFKDLGHTTDVSKTLEMLTTQYSDDKKLSDTTKSFLNNVKDWNVPNCHFSYVDSENQLESNFIFYRPCKLLCTEIYNRALIETYMMAQIIGLSPLEETMRDEGWKIPEGFLDNVEDTIALSIFGANYALSRNGLQTRMNNWIINFNQSQFLGWLDLCYGDFEQRDLKNTTNKLIRDLVLMQS